MPLNRIVLTSLLAGLALSAPALAGGWLPDDPSTLSGRTDEQVRPLDQKEFIWSGTPIADALASVHEDVRTYNDHIVTLANPWMSGRLPGTHGMTLAMDYVEHHFREYGLTPAFKGSDDKAFGSFRQPFPLGGQWEVKEESLMAMANEKAMTFTPDEDFVFTGLGGAGTSAGRAVFVGYGIDNGPEDWSSFDKDTDLTGKVAVMFRFEPMNADGTSQWSDQGWSNQASMDNKVRAAASRGAAAIVIINTPGANDPRANTLSRFGSSRPTTDVPVFFMSAQAGTELLTESDPRKRSIEDLIDLANGGFEPVELNAVLMFKGESKREPVVVENVGAVLPGKGKLADEYIVIGAHLDHLGMGYFGSRSGPGRLHPGADDNASGSAALVLAAEKLSEHFANDERDRRSILFVAFTAEESGLNGSRHYVNNPIVPLEQHVLMVNWDMIGRISNERLSVSGAGSGEGLASYIQPYLDASQLEIVMPTAMSGASDHMPFYQSRVPVLFSIIADFHPEYHTPDDVSSRINRVGAVKTVHMYHEIVSNLAVSDQRFPFQQITTGRRGGARAAAPEPTPTPQTDEPAQPTMGGIRVRFGVMPGSYDPNENGIPIAGVSEDGPAAKAGVQGGDRLVRWDGQKIESVEQWMTLLAKHNPGDKVAIGVLRDGQEVTLEVTLEGR